MWKQNGHDVHGIVADVSEDAGRQNLIEEVRTVCVSTQLTPCEMAGVHDAACMTGMLFSSPHGNEKVAVFLAGCPLI